MTKKAGKPEPVRARRREFTDEFGREAVQMMLDGHTAASVAGRLGLSGTNLLLSGTGGPTNSTYRVLTATNVALSLSNWVVLLTNQFNGSGSFVFTNSISQAIPSRFYILAVP